MSATTPSSRFSQPRIAVIGAGVVGLACALELAKRGAIVRVYERGEAPGAGASSRAAGMLGLAYEAPEYTSSAMQALAMRSMQLWPDLSALLHEMTGGGVGFRADGTIACATSDQDLAQLDEIAAACRGMNLPCEEVAGPVSRLDPALTGHVQRALKLKTDMQVDPKLLIARMAAALSALDAECVAQTGVERIVMRRGRFETPDGESWDQILLATGASEAQPVIVDEHGAPYDLGMRGMERVKGQILALEPLVGAPRHVVRAGVLYVVPKTGATLIGGISQPGADTLDLDRDLLDDLRARATRLLPGLAMAREIDAWAGFRPKTPDGAPLMGETRLPRVFVAGGHYRNGVLLAPATGEWMATAMLDGVYRAGEPEFSPLRFDSRVEPSHSP